MKSLVINKDDLRHNIKVIKKLAQLDTLDDNGNKYKIYAFRGTRHINIPNGFCRQYRIQGV